MAYAFNSKNKQKIGDLVSAEDPQGNTFVNFGDDTINMVVSGSSILNLLPSNIVVSGSLAVTNTFATKGMYCSVRIKNFGAVSTTDTTADNDYFLLYGTATNSATVTLHKPNMNGQTLIVRKTSDLNSLFITCSSGLTLQMQNNNNSNVSAITMSAGTNTNRMFVYNNNIWYELFSI